MSLWAVVVGPRHVPVSIFDHEGEARAYIASRSDKVRGMLQLVALAHQPGHGYPWTPSNRLALPVALSGSCEKPHS